MILGLIVNSLPPQPDFVKPAVKAVQPTTNGVKIAKACGEITRWYAWTRCGNSTCCKLFIACSNGSIITQSVAGGYCR